MKKPFSVEFRYVDRLAQWHKSRYGGWQRWRRYDTLKKAQQACEQLNKNHSAFRRFRVSQ